VRRRQSRRGERAFAILTEAEPMRNQAAGMESSLVRGRIRGRDESANELPTLRNLA